MYFQYERNPSQHRVRRESASAMTTAQGKPGLPLPDLLGAVSAHTGRPWGAEFSCEGLAPPTLPHQPRATLDKISRNI